jgi:hypothetical protein
MAAKIQDGGGKKTNLTIFQPIDTFQDSYYL